MDNALIPKLNPSALDTQATDIAQQILDESDVDKVKELTALFNLHAKKRNVVRILKLNHLMDNVTDKMIERFEKTPDNFSNEDLLKFLQVTENSIDKASKSLELVDQVPAIQLQQNNQVNINVGPTFDRQSRQKITDKVAELLQKIASGEYEVPAEDIEDLVEIQGENEDDRCEECTASEE
jgi:anti-sigma28 factor (negative regulator of flagellin synthesis)